MATDYDKIRQDNIREYGQGTRHLAFLGRLYSNRTHFIYELLQNAEDEGARRVLFILRKDCLIFLHDGKPFDERDVRGICGVGEGDKAGDLTKIGTFGIGFKSVYAYTSCPEIHSGEEHFCIKEYVRPCSIEIEKIQAGWTTSFLFPFDEKKVNNKTAYEEIADRLKHLSVRTLLFINNIQEITWQTAKAENGEYIKETKNFANLDLREVTVIGKAKKGGDEAESWLIFSRNIEMSDGTVTRPVEIAYKVEKDIIIPIVESPLVVFFPTEKESHLGFMVQGPYRTTPARDNIPNDDDWNNRLVMETSCLVISSLEKLRGLGMLDVHTLETMPIRADNFPKDNMFHPMFEHVKTELLSKDLIPGLGGNFISGKVAKIGRIEELRNLLKPFQLCELYDDGIEYQWISDQVSLDRTPDLRTYLMKELDTDEITPRSFAKLITKKFLASQSDEWMIRFYKFLLGQEALWKSQYSEIRNKPFVRLEDNSHVKPFDEGDQIRVYFPAEGNNTHKTIKSDLLIDDEAKEFFVRLGVSEPDIVAEVVEKVLPLYENKDLPADISDKDNLKHVDLIVRALKTDSENKRNQLISKLKYLFFLVGYRASNNERVFCTPEKLYIKSEKLELYFDGNVEAFFIGEQYSEKILNALNELILSSKVHVSVSKPNSKGYVVVCGWHGCHKRGLDGFDPEIKIDGLEHALSQPPTVEKSLFIWNELVIPYKNHIKGITESSNRKTYEDSEKSSQLSISFGALLNKHSWIPNERGDFFKPSDIKIADVDKRFDRDPKVASQLEMQDSELVQFADSVGLDIDDVELIRNIKENPKLLVYVKNEIEQFGKKAEFPKRMSKNSEHRRQKTIEKIKNAPKKVYKHKEQSTRTSKIKIDAQTRLRNYYTNDDHELICQLCQDVMPFKKRDGDYYMEAVELTSFYDKEYEYLFIALCPTCAAKYKEFIKRVDGKDKEIIMKIEQSEEPLIEVQLGDMKKKIRFVDPHFQDLKILITELGTPQSNIVK